MLAHSSAKLSWFDLIGIDVVGRVPMDVANDVAALRSCCAVSPARPRVHIMTSSSMSADGTVGSTGAAVVSELEPGKNTTWRCGPASRSRTIPLTRISPSILTMCRRASIPLATGLRSPRPPRTSRRQPLRAQATGSQTDTAAHFVLGQMFSARESSDGEVHQMCSLAQAAPCVDRWRL